MAKTLKPACAEFGSLFAQVMAQDDLSEHEVAVNNGFPLEYVRQCLELAGLRACDGCGRWFLYYDLSDGTFRQCAECEEDDNDT